MLRPGHRAAAVGRLVLTLGVRALNERHCRHGIDAMAARLQKALRQPPAATDPLLPGSNPSTHHSICATLRFAARCARM